MTTAGTVQPDPKLVATARELLADRGPKGAAERLGVSVSAVLRLAAGSNVRAGTLALASSAVATTTPPAPTGRQGAGS